jgi:homoserine O-succinyltransferase
MGDAALQTTEQQFGELLSAAGAEYDIQLRLFSFPELVRGDAARSYIADRYESIDELWNGDFDGLIVTGAEPRTASLPNEAYWPSLTRLVDWANDAAIPTVWSCLAAHAAVLHLDGIERRRLREKISGVFRCAKTSNHSLLAGLPMSWRIPHSRQNTLETSELASAGYEILSFSEEAGADALILRRRGLFLFLQGHPEYDAGTLFREYRRDIGRFLSGTSEHYPELPRDYFDNDTARAFVEFRSRAHRQRTRALLEEFPGSDGQQGTAPWRDLAVRLYANWLAHLVAWRARASAVAIGAAAPTRAP